MLSRLASRSSRFAGLRSSLTARPMAAFPTLSRDFSSTPPSNATSVTTGETEGPPAIVQKYGAATFWGCFAAILVSKEVFIVDAEFLLSMEIGLFALTGYVLTGDTFEKWSEEQDNEQKDKFQDATDFMLEMFQSYKGVQQTAEYKPEVVQQYLDAYKAALEENAAFQTVKPQHLARASVLATLESIRVREEHADAMEWQQTVDTAVDNVREAFESELLESGNQNLYQESLQLAIGNLGTDPPATQKDPVKELFMAQFPDEESDEESYEESDEEVSAPRG